VKTRQQAFEQVLMKGQLGWLPDKPTESYLLMVREYLFKWIEEADKALYALYKAQALEAELAAEFETEESTQEAA
jgi:hypothetical protein